MGLTREESLDTMGATLDDWIDKKNMHMLIDQIFNEHEAQLKAKDKEIERLKAESKQAYIEGSKSCDDLFSFYITKIASLEKKIKGIK